MTSRASQGMLWKARRRAKARLRARLHQVGLVRQLPREAVGVARNRARPMVRRPERRLPKVRISTWGRKWTGAPEGGQHFWGYREGFDVHLDCRRGFFQQPKGDHATDSADGRNPSLMWYTFSKKHALRRWCA